MGQPIPLQSVFNGFRQDDPRDQIANSAVWNMVDWIPWKLAAPLQKRGGWAYGSPALGATTYVQGLVRTPAYAAGEFNLAITSDGHCYKFTDNTDSDIGTAFAISQNPVIHRNAAGNWLAIITASTGTTTPKSYDGTTFGDLGGTPPKAIFANVWNDRLLLGNGQVGATSYPGRMWFGPVGDSSSTWDTTNSWWDFDRPIVGIGVTRNAILAFHARTTSRLRGTTPPTQTSVSDLVQDDPFPGVQSVGCIDARSIVNYGDDVIWADFTGVYMSDGVTIKNLTAEGGVTAAWRGSLINYVSGYSVASGVFKDVLVISILDNSRNPVDCFCYDLLRGFWYRFSHMPALCFMSIPGVKTYMGLSTAGRVANLETVFHDETASDADGTAVTPVLETPSYRGFMRLHRKWIQSMALQQWIRLYVDYEMVNGGAAPTLTVSYCLDPLNPENVTYTALSPTLPASALTSRVKRDLSVRGRTIAFKIQQTNASTDTMLRSIEGEFYPLEVGRVV